MALENWRKITASFTRRGWCPRPRLYWGHTCVKGFFSHGAGPRKLIAIISNGAFHTARAWAIARVRAKCSAGAPLVGQAPARVQKGAMGHCFQCTSSPAPCEKNPFTGVCPQCKRGRGHHPHRAKGAYTTTTFFTILTNKTLPNLPSQGGEGPPL